MQLAGKIPTFEKLLADYPNIKAILWDLDGTILFTEILHANAYKKIIEEELGSGEKLSPIDIKELEQKCIGQTDPVIFNILKSLGYFKSYEQDSFLTYKNEVMRQEIQKINLDSIIHESMIKLIKKIHSQGIKQAVVTSSEKDTVNALLDFVDLKKYFDFIISRADTEENKPSPLPYLLAMEKLALDPSECLVFEDSEVGMKAAKASLANTYPARWYY